MRVCSNCGNANQPTRKYCIRCGKSLLTSGQKKPAPTTAPTPEVPATGRVTTGRTRRDPSESSPQPAVTTDDVWVKPSEVARDRVRTSESGKRKTELEKAREAFSRAETVGLEEEGSGVVETRMLRASEVKELLEGPDEPQAPSPVATPEPAPAIEVPSAPEAPATVEPEDLSTSLSEAEILGSQSAFVAPADSETDAALPPQVTGSPVPSELSEEFTSSRYEDTVVEPQDEIGVETVKDDEEAAGLEYDLPEPPSTEPAPTHDIKNGPASGKTAPCPFCGTMIADDGFEYPAAIYSAMGQARLKQARFFVVQGKYVDAKKVVDLARSLFEMAKDEKGLNELEKLIGSLKAKG